MSAQERRSPVAAPLTSARVSVPCSDAERLDLEPPIGRCRYGDVACTRARCVLLFVRDVGSRPILLLQQADVGPAARPLSRTVTLNVDQPAFLAAHTGLKL